jgi:glutathione peroxidase-family protein
MSTFNDITMSAITGEPVKFSSLKGKVSLVVNVASQ